MLKALAIALAAVTLSVVTGVLGGALIVYILVNWS